MLGPGQLCCPGAECKRAANLKKLEEFLINELLVALVNRQLEKAASCQLYSGSVMPIDRANCAGSKAILEGQFSQVALQPGKTDCYLTSKRANFGPIRRIGPHELTTEALGNLQPAPGSCRVLKPVASC